MKNELFKIASLATILMAGAFVSCNENELDPAKGQLSGKKVSFAIAEDKTRTAYDPDNSLQINWTKGDMVRIFCDEAEDVKQADYTVAQIQQNTGKLVYNVNGLAWGGDDDLHNFYAVYPADDSKVSVDASSGIATFTVNHSQTCTVQGDAVNNHYSTLPNMNEAYMVAYRSTKPTETVDLDFKPIMTTLEITVQGAPATMRTVTLSGISVINKKATYPGVSEGKFKYDIVKKAMSEIGVENATTETYYVGIKNGNDTWIDLEGGQSITLTVFLPPVVIDNDNQVTIQVHATGELNAIIGGKTDANGKETNIAPSAKAKITLPAMPENKSGNNWITPLDDKIYVQQLSIPGTHDAAAYTTFGDLGTTQSLDLNGQLDLGIRAFDMRPAYRRGSGYNKMWMWHGFTACEISLEDALTTFKNYLTDAKNNQEFVILQFRHEEEYAPLDFTGVVTGKNKNNWDEIYDVLKSFDDIIVQWKPDLTIGDCRGKMILLTRSDYNNRSKAGLVEGFPYNDYGKATINTNTDYYVQDFYKYTGDSGAEKMTKIKDLYKITKEFKNDKVNRPWALNHTSGYEGVNVIVDIEIGSTTQYQRNAANVNKPIYEALVNESDFGPTGIVFMDWVGQRTASSYTVYGDLLPQAIIDNNYRYRMLRAE